MFIIVFTKTHHFSLSWVTSFESTLSHHISLRSDFIFSSCLCRVLPSGLYFSGIPTFYSFLFQYKSLAISVPFLSSYDVCWFCIMYHHIGTTAWFQPWLPHWCFSVCCFGFPVVRSRHRFLLREQFSFHPACVSWGFVTKLFYRVRELASFLTTDWRMRPLYLCPPRDRVAQLYSWTLSIHFSHLYDMHGVWWAYFCYWPSHGNCIMYTICVKTDYLWEFLMACEWKD